MNLLPKTVPVLKAEMICQGRPFWHGAYCLNSWLSHIFGGCYWRGLKAMGFSSMPALIRFNDGFEPIKPTKADLADLWNAAIPKLGYVREGEQFVLTDGRPS